jgi:hypothetical protein
MKEEWLFPGAMVPVDRATTLALVAEIKRLIDVVGGLILQQGPDYRAVKTYHEGKPVYVAQPAQEPHPAVKSDMLVNGGALKLALNSLRRGTQSQQEIADELEKTAQPAQEPVAWGYRNHDGAIYDCISPEAHADVEGDYTVPLYTTPQQRPWVWLTDDEMEIAAWTDGSFGAGARWANAKLKGKNT